MIFIQIIASRGKEYSEGYGHRVLDIEQITIITFTQ